MMLARGLTIREAREGLDKGQFSAVELCKHYFQKIKTENKKLNAFISLNEEEALESARLTDQRIKKGSIKSILDGVPLAIKDNLCQKGRKTTAGSQILQDYVAPYDATVVRLLKEAGAIILGKTNLDEFAMGSSTENSYFGPSKNPWDLTRVSGGSSGGSAVAVAADLCVAALGSDTGGSIRQPASFCGVVGLKPTYGAVSRFGLIAMASSFDQIGPLSKNVFDSAVLLSFISQKDPLDATSVGLKWPKGAFLQGLKNPRKIKVGLIKESFGEGLDEKVKAILFKAIEILKDADVELIEVSLPHLNYALAAYYVIMPAEVSSNLARYDGIRYGLSRLSEERKEEVTLEEVYSLNRALGFGQEVKRRIMLGTYLLSAGYYEAFYKKAQKIRRLFTEDFLKAFSTVDFLISPVSPSVAFKLGEKTKDPLLMYLSDIYTVPVNPAGLPAISLPCGFADNLPVGLQIIASHFEDYSLLQFSQFLENLLKGRL